MCKIIEEYLKVSVLRAIKSIKTSDFVHEEELKSELMFKKLCKWLNGKLWRKKYQNLYLGVAAQPYCGLN